MVMLGRMIHQLMPVLYNCLCRVWVLFRPCADDEKCRLNVVLVQYIQYLLRIVRSPCSVEGDCADLLIPVNAIDWQLSLCRRGGDRRRRLHRSKNGGAGKNGAQQRKMAFFQN